MSFRLDARKQNLYRVFRLFNLFFLGYAVGVLAAGLTLSNLRARQPPVAFMGAIITLIPLVFAYLGLMFWLGPIMEWGQADEEGTRVESLILRDWSGWTLRRKRE